MGRDGGHGIGWPAIGVAAVALSLAVQACGSSSNSTAHSTTSQASTGQSTSATGSSSTSGGGTSGNAHIVFAGDVNAPLTLDADALTCGQTGPESVVIRGVVGGHHGSLALKADVMGVTQFPSHHLASAAYLPDGTGGPSYSASAAAGTGQGSITFNQDGSGSVDLVIPYDTGSGGSNGSSDHITGTWKC